MRACRHSTRALVGLLALLAAGCGARSALEDFAPDAERPDAPRADAETVDGGADIMSQDAPIERCDGADNDGDGAVDEGLPTVECGVGACLRSACDAIFCTPGDPSPEQCGGGDDDCDGLTDEGLSLGPLGAAVEVREGAGGYDRCGTCSWAKDPFLTPRDDGGVFVQWHHGIYGGDEIPNMWGRVLDVNGQATGRPEIIGDNVQLSSRRIPGLDPRDGLSFAVERVGSRDIPRLWRISPGAIEEEAYVPFERCSRAAAIAYVDGRLITGCTSRGEASFRSQVIGEPFTEITFDVDDTFFGAALHGRPGEVFLAAVNVDVDRDERWMSFGRLSPTLDVLQPLTRSEAAYTRGEVAFSVPDGWLWWNLNWPDPVRGERLDPSGQVVGTAEPYSFRTANPPIVSVALGGGHHLVAIPTNDRQMFTLVRMDDRGAIIQSLEVAVPPNPAGDADYTGHLDLIEHRGEYWAAWIGSYAEDGEANHVQVQRFGCVAP